MMNNLDQKFETQLHELALALQYPPTPDISGRVRANIQAKRQPVFRNAPAWAWAVALILLFFIGAMMVPPVRAAVIEFLQIGAIRIFTNEEIPLTPTPVDSPAKTPALQTQPPNRETPLILNSLVELAGETTLADLDSLAPFPVLLPFYPPDLGDPDRVFIQELDGGQGVLLVWLEPNDSDQIQMSLLLLGPRTFAGKGTPSRIMETSVNGAQAVWTEGEHILVLQTGPYTRELVQLFVKGNVLIWEIDGITYRLEGTFPMEEAVRIAESVE